MTSKDHSEDLPLELDIPTTEADVVALRRARDAGKLPFAEALEILSQLELPLPEERLRKVAKGRPPFRLD
jgi:hypothetical protein